MKKLIFLVLLLTACAEEHRQQHFRLEVLNSYAPVKNQGKSQTCWAYAMLAAIETEHIMRGDSVNLSAAWVERKVALMPGVPPTRRGMGQTCLNVIQRYGLCPYDAMPTTN